MEPFIYQDGHMWVRTEWCHYASRFLLALDDERLPEGEQNVYSTCARPDLPVITVTEIETVMARFGLVLSDEIRTALLSH